MKKELLLILLFYALMAPLYHFVLVIDLGRPINPAAVGLNYLLKVILTVPLLWLFFRRLAPISIWKKGALHLITMPLFTIIWMKSYYLLCDHFGLIRLQGSRIVWDVYLTLLFYAAQFGIFHVYTYAKQLRAQELLSAELQRLNAESELSALKAQLNPHFLYNVFNTINSAIPTTAKNARNMVNELSDLFRYQLKASREKLVSLEEELEFVRKYLDLEKERFGKRLNYQITVGHGLEELPIPPVIIQPLVENSVKHGISPEIDGGSIKIEAVQKGDSLQISICDTGKGTKGKPKEELLRKGVGLSNTHDRLLKMYGKGLELKTNEPKGLCVLLSIPINTTAAQK